MARWSVVIVVASLSCAGEPAVAETEGVTSTGGTSTAGTAGVTDDGGSTGALDSSGGVDTSTTGSEDGTDTGSTDGTGTTGGIDEGPFAADYRLAFTETDFSTAVGTHWVECDIDGPGELIALLPGGDAASLLMVTSPSRRWLAVRGGAAPDAQGWIVDAHELGTGTADSWAFDLQVGALSFPVFFADESAVAYIGTNTPTQRVYARTLGDPIGPAVEIQSDPDNARSLARFDDQLVLADAAMRITTAPAAVAAASDTQVASTAELNPIALYLSGDGSAIYAREVTDWSIGAVDAGDPQPLVPLALAPEQGIQAALMSAARNRIVTIDYDGVSPLAEPVHAVDLDGASADPPAAVAIPSGGGGVITGAFPQLSADGDHFYIAAWPEDGAGVAYHVDWSGGGAPTVEEVAGGDVDDSDAQMVLLSHDETRLYVATKGAARTVKMVDLVGGGLPVDLAPGLAEAFGAAEATLVESADGRAVFFLGRQDAIAPVDLVRVGIVDGEVTSPVAMASFAVTLPSRMYPAPDGGALAWIDVAGELWFAHYGDGEPQSYMLSTSGFTVEPQRPPLFLALPPA